jgi:hypothetical protein
MLLAICSSETALLTLRELRCGFLTNDSDSLNILNAEPRWRDLRQNKSFPNFEEYFVLALTCESVNVQFRISNARIRSADELTPIQIELHSLLSPFLTVGIVSDCAWQEQGLPAFISLNISL